MKINLICSSSPDSSFIAEKTYEVKRNIGDKLVILDEFGKERKIDLNLDSNLKFYLDNSTRFELNCDNSRSSENYFINRAIQLLKFDIKLKLIDHRTYQGASLALFENKNGHQYVSIYVYSNHRGKGLFNKIYLELGLPVLTSKQCGISDFLLNNRVEYVNFDLSFNLKEYSIIEDWYGNSKATRSGVYLMNHIDEGICVINKSNLSFNEKILCIKAYCIHPLIQEETLFEHFKITEEFKNLDEDVLSLANDYKLYANSYLSNNPKEIRDIEFPLVKNERLVLEMLKADKIQNYKDFILYHKGKRENSENLEKYFKYWLKYLDVEKDFNNFFETLDTPRRFLLE